MPSKGTLTPGNIDQFNVLQDRISWLMVELRLTTSSRVHLDFLNRELLIQEGTLAEEVQGLLAIVGDSDLELRGVSRL
jgi:hypothetical protein